MIKKMVVLSIISLFLMNFTVLNCISEPITTNNMNEIVASTQDKSYLISNFYQGTPPLPPVMWTEDFSTFYIPTPQNPDGDEVRYHIDWGDGDTEITRYYSPGETAIIYHVWPEEGTYEIKIKAEDQDGESKWAVYTLSLSTDFKFFGVKIGFLDLTYTFTFYWENGSDCYFMVDWGDGETTDWLGPYQQPVLISHAWTLPGLYEIKLKMKDIWGNESDWCTFLVTILDFENNAPNKPNITGKWIVIFIVLECNFCATDPDGDDIRYHIDWDDGKSEITDFNKSGETVTIRHVYAEQGDFTITAYAEDIHGEIGPENSYNPRWKIKAVYFNIFFLKLLEKIPLLTRLASFLY
jgi:hypothetical protein